MMRKRLNLLARRPALALACLLVGLCLAHLFAPLRIAAADKATHAKAAAPIPGLENGPSVLDSPAVAAIRASNPTTPEDIVRAIDNLVNLGELPLAKQYVTRLGALRLSQRDLAALGEQLGPEILLRLAANKDLGVGARVFGNSALEAMHQARIDPRRIAGLIDELKSPSDPERAAARVDLKLTGEACIAPLLRVLGNAREQALHVEARTVLVSIGGPVVEPLLAVLTSPGTAPELKAQVAAVLYFLPDSRALDPLLALSVAPGTPPRLRKMAAAAVEQSTGSVPGREEVAARLEREVAEFLRGDRRLPSDSDEQCQVWEWNPRRGDLTQLSRGVSMASMRRAALLARLLHEVAPESSRAEQLHLIADLQLAKLEGGLGRPLARGDASYVQAARLGSGTVEKILARALAERFVPAASGAAELLGDLGDVGQLTRGGATPCPLVRAAEDPDRRLRLTALQAIARLHPQEPFAGAGFVPQSLSYFAAFSGHRRAVVGDPRPERAHKLASLLDQTGLTTSVATSGRELFQAAAASPEVEVVLIAPTLDRPLADDVIRQLRRDPRTARLPIGLIADPDDQYRAEGLALADPLVKVFVRPRDLATMRERIASLAALEGSDLVPYAQRQAEAAAALAVLGDMAAASPPWYDLTGLDRTVEPALEVPPLIPATLRVLGELGTARAQRTLVDLASNGTVPLATRKAAVAALSRSLKRRGIQLSIAEIQEQSRRYDRSATQDQKTQNLLWSILDALQTIKKQRPEQSRRPEAGVRQ